MTPSIISFFIFSFLSFFLFLIDVLFQHAIYVWAFGSQRTPMIQSFPVIRNSFPLFSSFYQPSTHEKVFLILSWGIFSTPSYMRARFFALRQHQMWFWFFLSLFYLFKILLVHVLTSSLSFVTFFFIYLPFNFLAYYFHEFLHSAYFIRW